MACSTLSLSAPSAAGVSVSAHLSSTYSPFVASSAPPMLSPLSSHAPVKSLSVSCSLSEKDTPVNSTTKALFTGLVAAGAALSVFTTSAMSPPPGFAATGPGGRGAERTAQKAQDLLKAADKLIVEDAPKRFGPGAVTGGNQDAGKVAEEAAGKTSQFQDAISSIAGSFTGQGDLQSAAEKAAGDTKSKVDEATGNGGPGGLFGSIKEKVEGLKESVEQKDAEAKKTLDEATGGQ